MTKERRLGRGLEALLSRANTPVRIDDAPSTGSPVASGSAESTDGLLRLNVFEIDGNPFQPRREFDDGELQSLAESIVAHGLLQPIVVRQVEGRYQLIAGERRLRAAIKAGISQIPAQLVTADDRQVSELAIVENLQRKDLNALEKAASFQTYLERYDCTQEELASRLKIDRSTVANLIRLLELPEPVQDAVRRGQITQGHARALLPLATEQEQIAFCKRIQNEALSVRATEQQVQESLRETEPEPLSIVTATGESRPAPRPSTSRQTAALEQSLRVALGCQVEIKQGAKGKGKIILHFANPEEFERLQGALTASRSHTRAAQ